MEEDVRKNQCFEKKPKQNPVKRTENGRRPTGGKGKKPNPGKEWNRVLPKRRPHAKFRTIRSKKRQYWGTGKERGDPVGWSRGEGVCREGEGMT